MCMLLSYPISLNNIIIICWNLRIVKKLFIVIFPEWVTSNVVAVFQHKLCMFFHMKYYILSILQWKVLYLLPKLTRLNFDITFCLLQYARQIGNVSRNIEGCVHSHISLSINLQNYYFVHFHIKNNCWNVVKYYQTSKNTYNYHLEL